MKYIARASVLGLLLPLVTAQIGAPPPSDEQTWPSPESGVYSMEKFQFDSGETLETLDIHYQTLGELKLNEDGSTNAVFIMHGTTGWSGQFLNDHFAGKLFNPGQALDAEEYFIIMRDAIGHGNSSNPQNTGLRAKFPSYQYPDMNRADLRLLTEHFGINRTRLHMGVSMGGMQTWLWGEDYPDFMDALLPVACQPAEIAGHNRLWRKFFIETILNDPDWQGGEYEQQPFTSLEGAMSILQVMFSSPAHLQRLYPTRADLDTAADELHEYLLEHQDDFNFDVNNQIFAWNASHTYDPQSKLGDIKAPLTAINTADDLMNPPELGFLEEAVTEQMKQGLGKAVVIPESDETIGHASYILAELWEDELRLLLERSGANQK